VQTHADLAPGRVALPGQVVEIHRLMRAVEAADPEMHHGGYQGGTVVIRAGDTVAECLQGGVGERNAELRILHDSPLSPPDGTPKKGVLGSVGSTGRAHGERARKRGEPLS
jgi:hypothetical protein